MSEVRAHCPNLEQSGRDKNLVSGVGDERNERGNVLEKEGSQGEKIKFRFTCFSWRGRV